MWIESHESLKEHPKLYIFMEELGITRPQAIGHLHLFWWWCSKYAASGKISGYSDLQISRAVDWDGDASRFRNALRNAGFVDEKNGVFEVHDWSEFRLYYEASRERIERKRKQARQRVQNYRDRTRNAPVTQEKALRNAPVTHPLRKVTRTNNRNNRNNQNNQTESIPSKKCPPKTLFLDCVKLTEEEYKKLLEKFGEAETKKKIQELNDAIMSKGYKYKSHYHTILNWHRRTTQNNNPNQSEIPESIKDMLRKEGRSI